MTALVIEATFMFAHGLQHRCHKLTNNTVILKTIIRSYLQRMLQSDWLKMGI